MTDMYIQLNYINGDKGWKHIDDMFTDIIVLVVMRKNKTVCMLQNISYTVTF